MTITTQELATTSTQSWIYDITKEEWITGSHEDLQQRILVLLDQARRCYEIEQENQRLRVDNQYKDDIIEEYREKDQRARRLRSNKEISPAHKLVLAHIEDKVSQIRPASTDPIRIDMTAVGEAVGLSRYTVGDKIRDLANWGAIDKTVEKVPMEKKGKKIEVDHVSAALKDIFFKAPEDIKPIKDDGEEYDRNHGGKRERCRRCKSINIRRVHHILCLNCGEEYISSSDEHTQDALLSEWHLAPRINESSAGSIGESSCHSDKTGENFSTSKEKFSSAGLENSTPIGESRCHSDKSASVSQDATRMNAVSPSLSLEESLTDEEADVWMRWRAISGESKLNETAYKHIQEISNAKITSTPDLQSLYDTAYNRLEELAKSQGQGKKAVPPRLGNLVKCIPEWLQAQKRRDQERTQKDTVQEHVVPGTGRLTNWTQNRIKGEAAPPLVYTRLETSQARKKPKGAGAGGLSKVSFDDLLSKRKDTTRKENPNVEKP